MIKRIAIYLAAAAVLSGCATLPAPAEGELVRPSFEPGPFKTWKGVSGGGVAENAVFNDLTQAVREEGRKVLFTTQTPKATWWGRFGAFSLYEKTLDTQYVGFTARWYSPDGELFWEDEPGSLRRHFATASLPIADAPASEMPGRWFVQIYFKGVLIDERFFFILDESDTTVPESVKYHKEDISPDAAGFERKFDMVKESAVASEVDSVFGGSVKVRGGTRIGSGSEKAEWGGCFAPFSTIGSALWESFRARWFAPNGSLYWEDTFEGGLCAETSMPIRGTPAATFPGRWNVQVFFDEYLIDQKSFTVEESA